MKKFTGIFYAGLAAGAVFSGLASQAQAYSWEIMTQTIANTSYSNNVRNSATFPDAGWRNVATQRFDIDLADPRWELNSRIQLGREGYKKAAIEDSENLLFEIEGQYNFSPRTNVLVTYRDDRDSTLQTVEDAGLETGFLNARHRRREVDQSVVLSHQLTPRWSVGLEVGRGDDVFLDADPVDNLRDADSDYKTVRTGFNWRQDTSFSLSLTRSSFDSYSSDPAQSQFTSSTETDQILAGFSHVFSPTFSVSGSFGPRSTTGSTFTVLVPADVRFFAGIPVLFAPAVLGTLETDSDGYIAAFNMTKEFERQEIRFSGSRVLSNRSDGSEREVDSMTLAMDHEFSEKLKGTFRIYYNNNISAAADETGIDDFIKTLLYAPRLTWIVNRDLRVEGELRHSKTKREFIGESEVNEATIRVFYTWDKWLGSF